MKVAVLILNYNNPLETVILAEHFEKMNSIDSVIIVDNNSTDDSKIIFKEKFIKFDSKITIFYSESNNGYSAGNNIGMRYLSKKNFELVFIANPDIWVEEKAILAIIDSFSENLEYSIISTKRKDIKLCYTELQYWRRMTRKQFIFESFAIYRKLFPFHSSRKIAFQLNELNSNINKLMEVECVPGSFFGMRLDLYNEIERFDENTFLYYEEDILSIISKDKKKKLGLLTDSYYEHRHEYNQRLASYSKFKIMMDSKKYLAINYLHMNKIMVSFFYYYSLFEKKLINILAKLF